MKSLHRFVLPLCLVALIAAVPALLPVNTAWAQDDKAPVEAKDVEKAEKKMADVKAHPTAESVLSRISALNTLPSAS